MSKVLQIKTHPVKGGPHPPEHITKHFTVKELLSEEYFIEKLNIHALIFLLNFKLAKINNPAFNKCPDPNHRNRGVANRLKRSEIFK